jgi:hypothetical protein
MRIDDTRRTFLKQLATATSAVVLAPLTSACGEPPINPEAPPVTTGAEVARSAPPMPDVPDVLPSTWNAISFNRDRGNAGAIPESYRASINGADGETKHIGKHLPYLARVDPSHVPAGYLALQWGDPARGYTPHPNAAPGPDNGGEGHWFDWIRVRKAIASASEKESTYPMWPGAEADGFAVIGGGDITSNAGKDTVYLVALPEDVAPGDTIRVYAHCRTHGEYVDFLTLPA